MERRCEGSARSFFRPDDVRDRGEKSHAELVVEDRRAVKGMTSENE